MRLLKCVAWSLVRNAGKALASVVPFGEVLCDVARDAWDGYHKKGADKHHATGQGTPAAASALVAEVQALAAAPVAEVAETVAGVVEAVAGDQLPEVQERIRDYLTQLPGTIRRSLRRPSDPTGTTAPPGLTLERAEDLIGLLPPRLPRFRPGDRPPGVGDWELVELLGAGGFGECGLGVLRGLTNLQSLDLNYSHNFTDAGASNIRGLTQLRSLDLSRWDSSQTS
jgi:hypothetical protein